MNRLIVIDANADRLHIIDLNLESEDLFKSNSLNSTNKSKWKQTIFKHEFISNPAAICFGEDDELFVNNWKAKIMLLFQSNKIFVFDKKMNYKKQFAIKIGKLI